ncbi:hypothetical protein BGZ72_003486 [Mortierella alpina]|nr:hypothetical protein BGZ72_003486 [Mortierella alpina]
MSNQDQSTLEHDQESMEDEFLDDEFEEDDDGEQDYYDPEDDLAYFHDQKLRIEESWLEWERQSTVNNRQNPGFHSRYNIFQKPGSVKRRDRRNLNAQSGSSNSRAGSTSSSTSAGGGGQGTAAAGSTARSAGEPSLETEGSHSAAEDKLRRLGSYRPALASSIVHSYSNLSWEATQAAREQRLAAKAEPDGSGVNILCTVPVELLSHIVSHLEPHELLNVSLVCQLLYHVVNADSCWKEAFIKFFGASIPFKRLDPRSWRGEYIRRTRLLRRWEKGRGSNILIDPKIGQISKLWAQVDNTKPNQDWFLAGGIAQSVVARCNPLLGKVNKDAVFRMVHLVDVEVSVMTMDQVLWGLTTGQVSLTTLAHAAAGQTFQTFAGFHGGPVSCVKMVPEHLEFVLTGGVDGIVRLWDVAKARTVREFRTTVSLGAPTPRIDHICCDPGSHIIAGTSGGEIYRWPVDIASIIKPASATNSGASTPARSTPSDNVGLASQAFTPGALAPDLEDPAEDAAGAPLTSKVIKLPEEFKGVGYLEVDFGAGHSGLILAQAVDAAVMHLYSLETLEHLATLKSPAHFSSITAVHWDIPKHEKPMISLSNGARSLAHLHGRQEMSSLLATGDQTGNICLWYLSDILRRHELQTKRHYLHSSQSELEPMVLEPTCVLKGHDTRVSSLFVDKLVIVSGSADGWVKAWNPVNGQLITVLNSGYIRGREVNDLTSSAVKCVVVNSLKCRGVVSIGGLIRSWDFSAEANLSKDKHRKHMVKKPIHYSAGPKNKIQNDIRHSLKETVSLKRLEAQAKERQDQLRRRYNDLEGLNMVDMTDEEVVEYVMMLSKDQEDQSAVQEVLEMERIQELELEQERALERMMRLELSNGGEGSSGSSSVPSGTFSSTATTGDQMNQDTEVSQQELDEEEELVRRAIERSLMDMETDGDNLHVQHAADFDTMDAHDHHGVHDCSHDHVVEWETSHVVDVDTQDSDDIEKSEDQQIVQSILQELQQAEKAEGEGKADKGKSAIKEEREPWPSVASASSSTVVSGNTVRTIGEDPKPQPMTWSMVARTNSEPALAPLADGQPAQDQQQRTPGGRQPAVIKQYAHSASQEEIEDDDTQLARILSLSMVEKRKISELLARDAQDDSADLDLVLVFCDFVLLLRLAAPPDPTQLHKGNPHSKGDRLKDMDKEQKHKQQHADSAAAAVGAGTEIRSLSLGINVAPSGAVSEAEPLYIYHQGISQA